MIHRKFLSRSFTNDTFAFTRRTCVAASKTILKEFRQTLLEDGPTLWIYHAFAVAAAITLGLDILHSSSHEIPYSEHESLVLEAMTSLENVDNSRIASRGARLLADLVKLIKAFKLSRGSSAASKRSYHTVADTEASGKRRKVDIGTLLHTLRDGTQSNGTCSNDRTAILERPAGQTRSQGRQLTRTRTATVPAVPTDPDYRRSDNRADGEIDTQPFASELEDIFTNLNAGFAGTNTDTFANLLNLSHNYSYT
ncbi:hypothetical protein LTR62_008293 [Meristemomyces frigidus]|uniref:Uncharacterized protein n=1 Tax=Meristemomyces frigidus TaxID=1508187 RepID=A0AAN7YCX8_9PEZI|nr:hypothetical protein LTR62_008293 [Meristemomyces frigidus]